MTNYATNSGNSGSGGSGSFIPSLPTTQDTKSPQSNIDEVEDPVASAEKREELKKGLDDISVRQQEQKQALMAYLSQTSPSDPSYYQANNALLNLESQIATHERVKKIAEEEDKFSLKDLALVTTAVGAGVATLEGLDNVINGDDIDSVNFAEELFKNTEAMTNPEVRQMIINASYGDQASLTDLENLSNYGNQFGSLSSDMFNGEYGSELESTYQEFLKNNPDIGRDQFLVEFARQNPTSQISQDINQKLSRFGQIKRGASEFGEIDRGTIAEGFQDASRFYKSESEGGYGFKPTDFRSDEQNRAVDYAFGLADSPEAKLLRENAVGRVRSGGKLGEDALRQITGDALTSVDPSLQAQPYLRSGGLAKSVLNTEFAQRKRLMEDESALFKILNADRDYADNLSGIVNSNNVDPVSAFGLAGKNSAVNANSSYSTNPTTGLNYDPTNAYATSVTAQNANIAQANATAPGYGSQIKDLAGNVGDINEAIEGLK
jgi:hypothetical protein